MIFDHGHFIVFLIQFLILCGSCFESGSDSLFTFFLSCRSFLLICFIQRECSLPTVSFYAFMSTLSRSLHCLSYSDLPNRFQRVKLALLRRNALIFKNGLKYFKTLTLKIFTAQSNLSKTIFLSSTMRGATVFPTQPVKGTTTPYKPSSASVLAFIPFPTFASVCYLYAVVRALTEREINAGLFIPLLTTRSFTELFLNLKSLLIPTRFEPILLP